MWRTVMVAPEAAGREPNREPLVKVLYFKIPKIQTQKTDLHQIWLIRRLLTLATEEMERHANSAVHVPST